MAAKQSPGPDKSAAKHPDDGVCHYCGLPAAGAAGELSYCCYGCRIADSIIGGGESGREGREGSESDATWQLTRIGLAIFFAMNVTVLTLAQWSWHIYNDAALQTDQAQTLFELLRYASLMLSVIVYMLLGSSLTASALHQLKQGRVTTDLLVAMGVVAALCYSAISVVTGGQHTYFEVACMVLVAMTLGRWFEATGKLRTTSSLRSLERLLPDQVRRVLGETTNGWTEETAPLESLQVGERIRVIPGERFPVDGLILQGTAAVDEMIMTGESRPSFKQPNDAVFAGTRNEDGDLLVRVTEPPHGGAVRRIVDAVVQAALTKSRLQVLADQVAGWMVPVVITLAVIALVFHAITTGWGAGLMAALSVLLIACPCALGVATPLAVWAAMGRASEAGVLFRNGDAVQALATVNHYCFDKTGTLTTGQPIVESLVAAEEDRQACAVIAIAAASASTHILSQAILDHLSEGAADVACLNGMVTVAGSGVEARLAPYGVIRLGRRAWMVEDGWTESKQIRGAAELAAQQGQPITAVGWEGRVRGLFVLSEQDRSETRVALNGLKEAGASVSVLTGDASLRTEALEKHWNVKVHAGLLPADKLAMVNQLHQQGATVAMVGDGINDAPAMAAADVGIAMGCGADVTRDAAQVCLLGDNLHRVLWAAELSRKTMKTVRQNLAWAFVYNGIGIGWAMCGKLNPILAAVAMVGSSLFVISNSLRLQAWPLGFPCTTSAGAGETKDKVSEMATADSIAASRDKAFTPNGDNADTVANAAAGTVAPPCKLGAKA